jgi:amino acid permease
MTIYTFVSGSFHRMAAYWVEYTLGFAVDWNIFIYFLMIVPLKSQHLVSYLMIRAKAYICSYY